MMTVDIDMCRISDNQWRADIRAIMDDLGITMEDLGGELKLTKGRISQILKPGSMLPYGFPERAKAAIQRIAARRAESVGLRVGIPKEDEIPE